VKGDNMGIIIGLDIGIASVGIAVVDKDTLDIKCVVSDLFDSADASKNIERRNNRQARRLNRRRKTRIGDFNTLWVSMFGELPEEVDSNVLLLRNAGLDEQLTLDEIYCVCLNKELVFWECFHFLIPRASVTTGSSTTREIQKALSCCDNNHIIFRYT